MDLEYRAIIESVIVIKDNESPQKGDIVLCPYEYVAGDMIKEDVKVEKWENVESYYDGSITVMPMFHPTEAPTIIHRNGKPCVYRNKLEGAV